MLNRFLVIIFLFTIFFGQTEISFAKEKEFKIEPVKKSDLGNKPFKDYPEAKARILFDMGNLLIAPSGDDFTTTFSRHLRLKMMGDTLISPYLINLDIFKEVEQVVIYTLNDNNVETIDITKDWKDLNKFEPFIKSLKQLKPGDILELKLSLQINSPYVIPGWQFEYEIPVNWSELRAEVPDIFVYRPVFKGFIPMLINTAQIKLDDKGEWVEGDGYYVNSYRFVIEKIPPFKPVSFSPSSRDYLTSVDFFLDKVKAYKGRSTTFGKSWGELNTALSGAEKLGKRIDVFNAQPYLDEMDLETDISSKTGSIYYWLKDKMHWNGELGIVAERPLNEVIESGTGSVAELNLLLVSFLKQAGVDATPVLLRTVELGNLNMALPQVSQFNYLVAYTRIVDTDVLMDISEPCLVPGLLRVNCLNGKGLNVNARFEDWIDLDGNKIASNRITIQAKINGDSLTGVIIERRKNYFALEDCINFNKGNEIIKFDTSLTITNISYAKMDSLITGNAISVDIDATALLQVDEQTFYLYPFWFESIEENPFVEKDRIYPVIFPYFFNYTWNFSIELQEGYKIGDLPEGETIETPDKSLRFMYSTKHFSQIIQVTGQLTTIKRKFDPELYQDLKTFYKEMIKKMHEPIKIKRQ
jgi:hypothetical protein